MKPEQVANVIAHHGVKGMKWGVHRSARIAAGETVVTQKRAGGKLKVAGGKGIVVHPDAEKAAVSKQRAKKSGTHALSNKELQDLVTRMNLEQQFSRLSSKKKGGGQAFVEEQLKQAGKQHVSKVIAKQSAKLAAAALI